MSFLSRWFGGRAQNVNDIAPQVQHHDVLLNQPAAYNAQAQAAAQQQVRFDGNPWGNQQYNEFQVIEYQDIPDFNNFQMNRGRAPRENIFESFNRMISNWMEHHLDIAEIVVPRYTYDALRTRYRIDLLGPNRFVAGQADQVIHDQPQQLILTTPSGYIKIICNDEERKFDLEKYIEVVD